MYYQNQFDMYIQVNLDKKTLPLVVLQQHLFHHKPPRAMPEEVLTIILVCNQADETCGK